MEGMGHWLVCKLLFESLRAALGDHVLLSVNQFLYWDARDPRRSAGPDVYGRLDREAQLLRTWKVWELGAPQFVIEVVSDSSWPLDVTDKPALYDRLGVQELIVFDPEADARSTASGQVPRTLRAWRRVEGALVELQIEADRYYAATLELWLRVVPGEESYPVLRAARGTTGEELVPTAAEAERQRADDLARQLAAQQAELERLRRER